MRSDIRYEHLDYEMPTLSRVKVFLGNSIVSIENFESLNNAPKERVFSQFEITMAESQSEPNRMYAEIYSAKEAVAKALMQAGSSVPAEWREIEVYLSKGQAIKEVTISGRALLVDLEVTCTGEFSWAIATLAACA